MTNPPICKTCRYHWTVLGGLLTEHYCSSPELGYNLVTGEPKAMKCHDLRKDEAKCGTDGKWHTQR